MVIRGETPHFDYVAGEAARGIADVGRLTGVPTIFGVVTAESIPQAVARAGGQHGNRGADAARTALAMADVLAQISRRRVLPRRTPTAVLGQATGAPVPAGGRGGPPRRVTRRRDTQQVVVR